MRLEGSAKRVMIFVGEGDRYAHHALAHAIVERAREEGLAGATVMRGIEGFGASSHLHTDRIVDLSEDLPIVVHIIDVAERIEAFLPIVDEMISEGTVTVDDVHVVMYRARTTAPLDDSDDGTDAPGAER